MCCHIGASSLLGSVYQTLERFRSAVTGLSCATARAALAESLTRMAAPLPCRPRISFDISSQATLHPLQTRTVVWTLVPLREGHQLMPRVSVRSTRHGHELVDPKEPRVLFVRPAACISQRVTAM